MPDPMRIDLEMAGLAEAPAAINAVGAAAHDLASVEQALVAANKDLAASLKAIGASSKYTGLPGGNGKRNGKAGGGGAEHVGAAEAAVRPGKTWPEFTKGKMGPYMRSEGSHAAAMARLSKEWSEYKAGVERQAAGEAAVAKTQAFPKAQAAHARVGGPEQRLEKARAAVAEAQNDAERRDAELAVKRAEEAIARANAGPKDTYTRVGGPEQRLEKARAALAQARSDAEQRDAELAVKRAEATLAKAKAGQGDGITAHGPQAALARARKALGTARTPEEQFDARLAMLRATKRVQGAEQEMGGGGPSFSQRLLRAVASSRFGAGGGMMPLLGRSLDVFLPGIHKAIFGGGGGAAAGALGAAAAPLAAVAAAAVIAGTAFSALTAVVMAASAELNDMNRAMTPSGGGALDVARLTAIGVSSGEVAAAASSLRERLSSDPWAMAAASTIGVGPRLGKNLGAQNQAKDLMRVLDGLRKVTDAEEQLRLARMMGVEGMLELAKVSGFGWEAMKKDAQLREKIADPKYLQQARDFEAVWKRVGYNLDTAKMAIGKQLLPYGAALGHILGNLSQDIAEKIEKGDWKGILSELGLWGGAEARDNARVDRDGTLRENNERLAALPRAIEKGMAGGGPRARSAIPAGWTGPMLEQVADKEALLRGYFRI